MINENSFYMSISLQMVEMKKKKKRGDLNSK